MADDIKRLNEAYGARVATVKCFKCGARVKNDVIAKRDHIDKKHLSWIDHHYGKNWDGIIDGAPFFPTTLY